MPTPRMRPVIRNSAGLGTFFWLIEYLAGIILFFTPFKSSMGWILLIHPCLRGGDVVVVQNAWASHCGISPASDFAWMPIAAILDYIFIVMLFGTTAYYAVHVLLCYAHTVLIPLSVGR